MMALVHMNLEHLMLSHTQARRSYEKVKAKLNFSARSEQRLFDAIKLSFAMYSNLQTEGQYNNHMFMPKVNVVRYQEDLVDILETNHLRLQKWIEVVPLRDRERVLRKVNVVHFELNRVIAETMEKTPTLDFFVRYTRNNGPVQTFRSSDPGARDHEVAQLEPLWKRKLVFFRPVFAGEMSYCQH